MNHITKLTFSDLLGITASGLCTVHCLVAPLFFASKPLFDHHGGHAHGTGWWASLDFIFLLLSMLAVYYSSKHTGHQSIKRWLWIAWFVFASGLLMEKFHIHVATWFLYSGSIALVLIHLLNYRYCIGSQTK